MQPQGLQSSSWATVEAVYSSSSGIARPAVVLDSTHGCIHVAQDGSLTCQPLPSRHQQAQVASRRPAAAAAAAVRNKTGIRLLAASPCSKYIAAADEQSLHISPTVGWTHPSSGSTTSSNSSSSTTASIAAARVKRVAWHPSISGLLAYTRVGQCRASLVQVAEPSRATVSTGAPSITTTAAAAGTGTRIGTAPSPLQSSSSSDRPGLQWQAHDGCAVAELPAGQLGQPSSAPPAICWVTTASRSAGHIPNSNSMGNILDSDASSTGSREPVASCCLAAAWGGRVVLYQWQQEGTQSVPVATQLLLLDCSDAPIQMAYSPAAAALVMTFEAPLALSLPAAVVSGGCSSETGASKMLLRPVRPPIVTKDSSSNNDSKGFETGSSILRPGQPQAAITSIGSQGGVISVAAPPSRASMQASVLDQLMCISLDDSEDAGSAGSTAQEQQQQQPQKQQPLVQVVDEGEKSEVSNSRTTAGGHTGHMQQGGNGPVGSSVGATIASLTSSSSQQVPVGGARVAVLPIGTVLAAAAASRSTCQAQAPVQQEHQEQECQRQMCRFSSVLPVSMASPDLLQLQGPLVAGGSSTGAAAVQLFCLQAGPCQLQQVGTFLLQPQGWPSTVGHSSSSTVPGTAAAGATHSSSSSSSSSSSIIPDASLCQMLLEVPRPSHDSSSSNGSSRAALGLEATSPWLLHAVLRPRAGTPPGGVHFALRTGPAPSSSSSASSSRSGVGGITGGPKPAAAAAGDKARHRPSTMELCLATFDLQPALPQDLLTGVASVQEPVSEQQHSSEVGAAGSNARSTATAAAGAQRAGDAEILEQLLQLQVQMQAGFQGIMQQLERQEARLAALEALVQRPTGGGDS